MSDVSFFNLHDDGTVSEVKTIKQSDIARCPSFIFLAEHYREDGSCRHDEPNCEFDGCNNLKWNGEIYCDQHLEGY